MDIKEALAKYPGAFTDGDGTLELHPGPSANHLMATHPISFTIKDSGKRLQFQSGMMRDTVAGKTNHMLAFDGPMFERWAEHLTKGAKKYAKRNWMKANSEAELERALESLGHHFISYIKGEVDEDHAAAIFFNINLAEYVKGKLDSVQSTDSEKVS